MSFTTAPKNSPSIPTPPGSSVPNPPVFNTPRERAIAKIMGSAPAAQQAQAEAVPNPTNVSPEELGAIRQPQQKQEVSSDNGQNTTSEDTSSQQVESKEETKPKEELLSQQYAVLARKEKALRAKVQAQDAAFKAQEAAIKAREDAIKAKDAEYQSNYIQKDQIAKDPFTTLQELGISYDQLTEMALNQQQADPATKLAIQKLEQRLEAQAKALEDAKRSVEDQQKSAYNQAVNQLKVEARQLINNDPSFETIKETGSIGDVVELIEQTFKSDGILLSVEDAAKEVEEYLVEEAMKLMKLKKIQQRMAPAPKQPEAAPKQSDAQPKQNQMKTLTNSVSSSRQMSAKERAILAFKGQLKS